MWSPDEAKQFFSVYSQLWSVNVADKPELTTLITRELGKFPLRCAIEAAREIKAFDESSWAPSVARMREVTRDKYSKQFLRSAPRAEQGLPKGERLLRPQEVAADDSFWAGRNDDFMRNLRAKMARGAMPEVGSRI